jgi:hypothetical protein
MVAISSIPILDEYKAVHMAKLAGVIELAALHQIRGFRHMYNVWPRGEGRKNLYGVVDDLHIATPFQQEARYA